MRHNHPDQGGNSGFGLDQEVAVGMEKVKLPEIAYGVSHSTDMVDGM